MNFPHGNGSSSEISSSVFTYPFEKTIKAISNIIARRKLLSSIFRLLAVAASIAVSIYVPQIPAVSIYLIGFISAGIGVTGAGAIAIGSVGMAIILTGISIAITKKFFQYYHKRRYGFSNPEHRLTNRDIEKIRKRYPELSETQIDVKIDEIRKKIHHLSVQIRKYKSEERHSDAKALKYILNRLKTGDLETYDNYYRTENFKRAIKKSNLRKKLEELVKKYPELAVKYEELLKETADIDEVYEMNYEEISAEISALDSPDYGSRVGSGSSQRKPLPLPPRPLPNPAPNSRSTPPSLPTFPGPRSKAGPQRKLPKFQAAAANLSGPAPDPEIELLPPPPTFMRHSKEQELASLKASTFQVGKESVDDGKDHVIEDAKRMLLMWPRYKELSNSHDPHRIAAALALELEGQIKKSKKIPQP